MFGAAVAIGRPASYLAAARFSYLARCGRLVENAFLGRAASTVYRTQADDLAIEWAAKNAETSGLECAPGSGQFSTEILTGPGFC
ncbi:MAG: hypothetical protein MnENMB40S_37630 [Rhizobiaceae bacterium MnEN-MB40S]|nr:MAG: hypothetical protein MnENMB40S_37630 [Rhizobiaceae bacterium MnEN-MB40S]